MNIDEITNYFTYSPEQKQDYILAIRAQRKILQTKSRIHVIDKRIRTLIRGTHIVGVRNVADANNYIDRFIDSMIMEGPLLVHKSDISAICSQLYGQALYVSNFQKYRVYIQEQERLIRELQRINRMSTPRPSGYPPHWRTYRSDEVREDTCPICAEDYSNGQILFGHSNHIFHKNCIDRWYRERHTCPICRSNFGKSNKKTRKTRNIRKSRKSRKNKV